MVTVTSGPATAAPLAGEVMVTCGCCWAHAVDASANGRSSPNTATMRNIEPLSPKSGSIIRRVPRLKSMAMPFELDDLDHIRVRVGMGTKSLREMSDTQFMAWLRAQGARGEIGVVKLGPGEFVIPIEERVRVLNDLHQAGMYIPDVMGVAAAPSRP